MNATAPIAILPVIQVLSELIWSMRHEQTSRACIGLQLTAGRILLFLQVNN